MSKTFEGFDVASHQARVAAGVGSLKKRLQGGAPLPATATIGASSAIQTLSNGKSKPEKPAKRVRQDSKPLMNRLETAFSHHLADLHPGEEFYPQAVTLKIANGLRYYPDFVSFNLKTVWEVKGEWIDGDSIPKLKTAASVFKQLTFWLVWRDDGEWKFQRILP